MYISGYNYNSDANNNNNITKKQKISDEENKTKNEMYNCNMAKFCFDTYMNIIVISHVMKI